MTVLAPRFALLGAFAAVATLSSVQETNGAAIHARQGYQPYRQFSRRFSHPSTRTVQRRQETPTLALPPFGPNGPSFPVPPVTSVLPIASRPEGKVSRSSHSEHAQRADKRRNMLQPLFQADDIWIGDKKGDDLYVETGVSEPEDYRLGKRYSSKIASSMDRVQANDNPSTPDYVTAITGLIVETREPHKQEHAEKMLTTGDYDAVKVEERRSSAASGVPPLPNVPSPASVPASLPLQGAPYVSSASLPADVPYNLPPPGLPSVQRRILDHSDTIGVNLESHQPDALAKRHEEKGVPGRVDVVSPVNGSSTEGERIASLVINYADANGTLVQGSPIVLDASGTNFTQMYLVPLPDPEPDASGTNSTTAANSTGSVSTPSSSGLSSAVHKVVLQIPLFNASAAEMVPFCATFDPSPSTPGPMTVTHCGETDLHQSQIFQYESDTGIIRPMWFEDDGASAEDIQDIVDDGNDDDDDDDGDASSDLDGPSNSTTPIVDPTTSVSNKMARVTAAQALRARFLGSKSFAAEVNSTPSPGSASASFNSTLPSNARNVTMVFVPLAPQIVSPQRAEAMQIQSADPTNSTDSFNSTASLTGISSAAYPTGTASAGVAALDYTSDSSYSTYSSYSSTATYTSAVPTGTDLSAAGYDDGYDYSSAYYSATPTVSSDYSYPTTTGYSAADADFDDSGSSLSSSYALPTLSSSATDSSATSSATGVSAAGFGFAESTVTATPTASSDASYPTDSSSSFASATDGTPSASVSALPVSSGVSGLPAAAFDVSTSAPFNPTSTYASDNSTATLSGSASGFAAEALPTTASAFPASKTLGVEVFDPSIPVPDKPVGAQDVSASDSTVLPSATSSTASSSAAASMTPVSTDPYKWMFKKESS